MVTLDMETIQEAQLSIDANIVKESILQTPKLKKAVRNFYMVVFSISTVTCKHTYPMAMLTCSKSRFWTLESWR